MGGADGRPARRERSARAGVQEWRRVHQRGLRHVADRPDGKRPYAARGVAADRRGQLLLRSYRPHGAGRRVQHPGLERTVGGAAERELLPAWRGVGAPGRVRALRDEPRRGGGADDRSSHARQLVALVRAEDDGLLRARRIRHEEGGVQAFRRRGQCRIQALPPAQQRK